MVAFKDGLLKFLAQYQISTLGASGGNRSLDHIRWKRGSDSGRFCAEAGDTLVILVGQKGTNRLVCLRWRGRHFVQQGILIRFTLIVAGGGGGAAKFMDAMVWMPSTSTSGTVGLVGYGSELTDMGDTNNGKGGWGLEGQDFNGVDDQDSIWRTLEGHLRSFTGALELSTERIKL